MNTESNTTTTSAIAVDEIFQLGYASAASTPFSEDELRDLLAKARANNAELNVSGMLLYHEGSFIQVLEGDQDTVEQLYAKIADDPRHTNALLLFKGDATERSFDEWTMGFHELQKAGAAAPAGLNQFLDNGVTGISSGDGETIKKVLLGFRTGRWRRTVDY